MISASPPLLPGPTRTNDAALAAAASGLLHGALAVAVMRAAPAGPPRLVFANPAFTRLTGIAADTAQGPDRGTIAALDAAPELVAALTQAAAAGIYCEQVVRHQRPDGSSFWNGLTIIPAPAATADGPTCLVLMRDVTPQRRTEDRLMALTERLRDLAMTDPLTGVGNRRSFDMVLEREWGRAERADRWLTLAMIDIDYFKRFNDRFGHPAGDTCLKAVAETLERVIRRPSDFLARYGGEEFAILMPEMEAQAAAVAGERLIGAVRAAGGANACPPITISCGIVSAAPGRVACGPDELVRLADRALYVAKEAGRDRMHQACAA